MKIKRFFLEAKNTTKNLKCKVCKISRPDYLVLALFTSSVTL